MDAFDLKQWEGYSQSGGSLTDPAIIDQIVIDSRRIDSPHALFVALKGNNDDGHLYLSQAALAGAKFALVSDQLAPSSSYPGMTLLRVSNTLKALQSIAKAYRNLLPAKIIAITAVLKECSATLSGFGIL